MTDEARLNEIRTKIAAYSKAAAQRDHLDEFKKSKLAILMKKYEREGFTTAAAQEREARADKDYLELLDGLKAASEEAERLRWELKLEEWKFEAWRTKQANQRAERRAYGA